jgi:hypothetical protein
MQARFDLALRHTYLLFNRNREPLTPLGSIAQAR